MMYLLSGVSAIIKLKKCGTGNCNIYGNHSLMGPYEEKVLGINTNQNGQGKERGKCLLHFVSTNESACKCGLARATLWGHLNNSTQWWPLFRQELGGKIMLEIL